MWTALNQCFGTTDNLMDFSGLKALLRYPSSSSVGEKTKVVSVGCEPAFLFTFLSGFNVLKYKKQVPALFFFGYDQAHGIKVFPAFSQSKRRERMRLSMTGKVL